MILHAATISKTIRNKCNKSIYFCPFRQLPLLTKPPCSPVGFSIHELYQIEYNNLIICLSLSLSRLGAWQTFCSWWKTTVWLCQTLVKWKVMERRYWRLEQQSQNTNTCTVRHTNTFSILISPSFVLQLGQKLFTATDAILSPGQLNNSEYVTGLLGTVENAILLIGPQLKANSNKIETTETGNSVHKLSCVLHTHKFPWMTLYVDFN